MKKISFMLIVGLVLLFAVSVSATPFLVSDPQAGISVYKLTGPSWVPATVPAQPDGSLKTSVAAALNGTNSLTVTACVTDALWGELCSPPAPFGFSKPANPLVPATLKLIK
jgi:hypothetical protein